MEHSNNYKALLILRKALELHIAVDPSEAKYGCTSAGDAQEELGYTEDALGSDEYEELSEVVYVVNFKAYDQRTEPYKWRNCYGPYDSEDRLSTAELRQYRIANFYRAIDLQEKIVAAEALEEVLKYYVDVQVPMRLNDHGVGEPELGFCTSISHVLRDDDIYTIARKYWWTVCKHSPHPAGLFWFDTVQQRIDAVTKLINDLKGN